MACTPEEPTEPTEPTEPEYELKTTPKDELCVILHAGGELDGIDDLP